MEHKGYIAKNIYAIIFSAAVFLIIAFVLMSTDVLHQESVHDTSFSTGWRSSTADDVNVDDLSTADYGGSITLYKDLPVDLTDDDSICFESKNVNLKVWIDDREVYEYTGRDNFTGKGYGVAYHSIGLSSALPGSTVKMTYESVLHEAAHGFVARMFLGRDADYLLGVVCKKAFAIVLSLLVFFFGIFIMVIYAGIQNKERAPFSLSGLSGISIIMGLWGFADTNIIQILTGAIYACRVLNMLLPFLVGFPLVVFFNSLTEKRDPKYGRIAFYVSVFFACVILSLRYVAGIDMIYSFFPTALAFFVVILGIVGWLFIDDRKYAVSKGRRKGLRFYHYAILLLMAGIFLDLLAHASNMFMKDTSGRFTRIGMVAFIGILMTHFIQWWSNDQRTVNRDRFINQALHHCISPDSPEVSIKKLLEYMGKEFDAGRTYIYEDNHNGMYHNTYEWFAPGMNPRTPDFVDLPYKGLVDELYEVFKKDERLIVDDPDKCEELNPILYLILNAEHIDTFVVGPLEIGGELIGFFGVDDAPRDELTEISEIISLISFFFSQLVSRRDMQQRLTSYSYHDPLTGVYNRRALKEFTETELDMSAPFGYVMCDANGLKNVNDTLGHDEGDKMIVEMAICLMEVFGKSNVYRLGGDEFVAFSFENTKEGFDKQIDDLRMGIEETDYSASIGSVYCSSGTTDFDKVSAKADALMYVEKKKYYEKNDRRSR